MTHDPYCTVHGDYYTSGCDPLCDFYIEAVQECKDSGEHFRRIVSEGGYDVCHNCGAKA